MARTRYVPEQEPRERRYGRDDEDFKRPIPEAASPEKPTEWEFQSVDNFVEFLMDEDRTTYTTAELVALATCTGTFNTVLRALLEEYGLTLVGMPREKNFATFGTNQHDRWTNSEARRINGGGGGNSILGMC